MKYFSRLILILTLFSSIILSQENIEIYSKGMENFNQANYSNAIHYFEQYLLNDEIDEQLLSSALVHIGESLLGLEQIDGAISLFENFIKEYQTSNYIPHAL